MFAAAQRFCWALALATGVLACSPALDWREVRPEGTALQVLMPCKPQHLVRHNELAGHKVAVHQLSCQADGAHWSLMHADVVDPARTGAALLQWRAAVLSNLQLAVATPGEPGLRVAGATPNDQSGQWPLRGQFPDGRSAHGRLATWAHGTRVFQAAVLAPQAVPGEAAATFLDSLRLGALASLAHPLKARP